MSRIGKKPVAIPDGASASLDGRFLVVSGPKGELRREINPEIAVEVSDGKIIFSPRSEGGEVAALWGLNRALAANMITGVTEGFRKELEMVGLGYGAEVNGDKLSLKAGHSHLLIIDIPEGITVEVKGNTSISVAGSDGEVVGQVAANIRSVRPPEPYKGKGIRYAGEKIRRKAGKAAKVGAAGGA